MDKLALAVFTSILCAISPSLFARPYPGISGLAATADTALTAGTNPAGIARLEDRTLYAEIMLFSSESEWESSFSEENIDYNSDNSGEVVVPRFAYVHPINDKYTASFTFLGAAFSDDFDDDWPGRYFIIEYDSIYVSAYPSIAYRINEQWSVAASLAITYTRFEQERAIRNIFDPGFGDGRTELEADDVEFGFGLSTLFELSPQTRFGLAYQAATEPSQDADVSYSNLGPNTEAVLEARGILDADLTLESKAPQSLLLGAYHEFDNGHAISLDLAWIDFSEFTLSEYYFDGDALAESAQEYKDIYGAAISYTFPVADRWMLGIGGALTNEMVEDDKRTLILRADAIWSMGLAAEYQWTEKRTIRGSLAYIGMGDAPVETASIPGLGSLEGEFTSRDTWMLQIGMGFDGI